MDGFLSPIAKLNNAIEREVSNESSHTRYRPGKECLPASRCRPQRTPVIGTSGPPRTAAQGHWRTGTVPHRHRSLHGRILLAAAVREARSRREDHGASVREAIRTPAEERYQRRRGNLHGGPAAEHAVRAKKG